MEPSFTYFEIRPGMDVGDAAGESVGTVRAVWQADESGQYRQVAMIAGFCPSADHSDRPAARFCLADGGYLIAEQGFLWPDEVVVPFRVIATVTDATVMLSVTREELKRQQAA